VAEPRDSARDARRDDPAKFLRELRELRNHAGLDHAELAARAHYPSDVIRAAEAGPSLPDLPVLSAYVRGCGGTPAEWEERWRAVTGRPASPLLTTRATGWSEAANAGARVSAASAAADGHDPERVMAALNRVADGMAAAAASSSTSAGGLAADDWDFGSADDQTRWAAPSDWDHAPAATPAWGPAPKAPSAWDAVAADPVWDPAPAPPAWDPGPPAPPRSPAPPVKRADYAASPAAARNDAAPVRGDAPRPAAPAGTGPLPAVQASRPRRLVSSRRLVAVLVVVTVIITVLTVVAAVLAFA
jgi:hypothetical protein